MISIGSAYVTGLSTLSRTPFLSNQAQNQTGSLTEQAPLIYCSSLHLQLCPLADATVPFQWSHHLLLQLHPILEKANKIKNNNSIPKLVDLMRESIKALKPVKFLIFKYKVQPQLPKQ